MGDFMRFLAEQNGPTHHCDNCGIELSAPKGYKAPKGAIECPDCGHKELKPIQKPKTKRG